MSAMTTEQIRLQRRQALTRAGLASAIAVALLLVVLIFEDGRVPEAAPDPVPVQPQQALPAAEAATPVETPAAAEVSTAPAGVQAAPPEIDPSPAPQPASETTLPPVAKPTAIPLANGYLVQLGVFGSMDNADGLRADVAARGLPAHVEGRVVVGPFPDKAAAEAARARLKREGLAAGIVVPPRKSK